MVRTQIQLTPKQARALHEMALERKVSMASLVRQAVDLFLLSAPPSLEERQQRALTVIGAFDSGRSDVAEEHDRYLAEAYEAT